MFKQRVKFFQIFIFWGNISTNLKFTLFPVGLDYVIEHNPFAARLKSYYFAIIDNKAFLVKKDNAVGDIKIDDPFLAPILSIFAHIEKIYLFPFGITGKHVGQIWFLFEVTLFSGQLLKGLIDNRDEFVIFK